MPVVCALQTPLADFWHIDAFLLYMPDELHQCDKGLKEHMMAVLRDLLDVIPGAHDAINKSLSETPHYPNLKLPTRGLDAPKLTAREVAALFLCLPVACLPYKKLHAWVECAVGEPLRRRLSTGPTKVACPAARPIRLAAVSEPTVVT